MKEGFEYRLLKYRVTTYCQGSEDIGIEYALLCVPSDSTFNNIRITLLNEKHQNDVYEIDINSVENLTIMW